MEGSTNCLFGLGRASAATIIAAPTETNWAEIMTSDNFDSKQRDSSILIVVQNLKFINKN